MPFKEISAQRGTSGPRKTGVSMTVTSNAKGSPNIQIKLGHDVVERLNLKKGNRVEVYRGDGPDIGKYLLQKTERGGRKLGGGPYSLHTNFRASGEPVHSNKVECEFEIGKDDSLTITNPELAKSGYKIEEEVFAK